VQEGSILNISKEGCVDGVAGRKVFDLDVLDSHGGSWSRPHGAVQSSVGYVCLCSLLLLSQSGGWGRWLHKQPVRRSRPSAVGGLSSGRRFQSGTGRRRL
jgi:hypothetical protein